LGRGAVPAKIDAEGGRTGCGPGALLLRRDRAAGGRERGGAGLGLSTTMNGLLKIKVFHQQQVVYEGEFAGPVELGRQSEGEDVGRPRRLNSGEWRVVIARFDENTVSRKHALIEPINATKIRLTNLSNKLPIRLPIGTELLPSASSEVMIPAILTLGAKTVRVQECDDEPEIGGLQSLSEVTRPPGRPFATPSSDAILSLALPATGGGGLQTAVDPENMVRWLQSTISVLQDATNNNEFYEKAAQALVENVRLDSGWVMSWEGGGWAPKAYKSASHLPQSADREPSKKILNKVRELKKTSWQAPDMTSGESNHSLAMVKAVVASPILNGDGEVIAALYGDRRRDLRAGPAGQFTKLDALLVELLANTVATGVARVAQKERAEYEGGQALKYRNQFEQFFRPELARKLLEQPDLMDGRKAEISILFCDIRGFSAISEKLGPEKTFEWINDVMGALSDCVLKNEGILVDYIGDELMAMWNAPEEQQGHARLACQAALDMLEMIPVINERWAPTLKLPMAVGIGINTGLAQIGNTGSKHKFKYGPLGNTVNLGSRVQGATKYLKSPLVITGPTLEQLDDDFHTRKLCSVSVVNIEKPVELHELVPPRVEGWADLQVRYSEALREFEAKEFRKATKILGNLLADYPSDGPSLVLTKRAVNGLIEGPDKNHPVWELPGK